MSNNCTNGNEANDDRTPFFKLLQAKGKAEGEHAKAIETARKFLEHGVSWDIITDSTGLRPADLKKTAKK